MDDGAGTGNWRLAVAAADWESVGGAWTSTSEGRIDGAGLDRQGDAPDQAGSENRRTQKANSRIREKEQGNAWNGKGDRARDESPEISLNLIPDVTPVAGAITGVRETHKYRSEKRRKEEDSFLFHRFRIQRFYTTPSPYSILASLSRTPSRPHTGPLVITNYALSTLRLP